MVNVVYWTLRGMNKEFDETEFTLACLNISYAGEMRIEAASKVRSLFYAEEKFYKNIYPYLLRNLSLAQKIAEPHNNKFILRSPFVLIWLRRQHLKWFLLQSQIRGILRWPKFLFTVDDWVEIMLAKIKRTKGIDIELTAVQRRHPLIFGWGHFFRLLRAGAIGSSPKSSDKKSLLNK
jgi:hypothetical protein